MNGLRDARICRDERTICAPRGQGGSGQGGRRELEVCLRSPVAAESEEACLALTLAARQTEPEG
jgi:hypothetical protein